MTIGGESPRLEPTVIPIGSGGDGSKRTPSYHQLRAAIVQVGQEGTHGKTEIAIEISNQCARLIANAIIYYYNSAILSRLVANYGTSPSEKALAMIKKVSPAGRRHIHLNGCYTFRDSGQVIDLDAIVAGLNSP